MGITVTDADIDTRLEFIKKQYFGGSEKKYLAGLKKQGYTDAEIRTDVIRPQLVSEAVQKQVVKNVKVTDADVDAVLHEPQRRTTRSPSRATSATSSSGRARRPPSRSTTS